MWRILPVVLSCSLLACGTEAAVDPEPDASPTVDAVGASDVWGEPDALEPDDTSPDVAPLHDVFDVLEEVAAADAGPEVEEVEEVEEGAGWPHFDPTNILPVPAPAWFYQARMTGVVLDDNGESEDLFFDLPEETTSVFVMVEGEESAFLTLKKAVTPPPLSESIVKGAGGHVCIPCKNRVVSAQHIGSFLLPNDPDVAVKGGEWAFKVRATHRIEDLSMGGLVFTGYPSTCDVTVLARTEPVPDTGVVRLRLHFTGSHGLTAEAAPDDERLQQGLDQLTAIYATAGVGVEIAGYHDVPGVAEDPTLTEVGSTAGLPNDLSKLFLTGYTQDPGALNVFFVTAIYKDLDYEEVGGIVLGIAGGVPGPAYLGSSYRSGVAVATFEISEDDHLGNVLAHEVGHYLGLFHSTEKEAIFHDTLDDTGESDPSNLMFWGWSVDGNGLSEAQSYILRSHPMVLPDE